jgi:hypothetical protein
VTLSPRFRLCNLRFSTQHQHLVVIAQPIEVHPFPPLHPLLPFPLFALLLTPPPSAPLRILTLDAAPLTCCFSSYRLLPRSVAFPPKPAPNHLISSNLQQQHCGRGSCQQQRCRFRLARAAKRNKCILLPVPCYILATLNSTYHCFSFLNLSKFILQRRSAALVASDAPLQPLVHFKQPAGDGQQVKQ